MSLYIFNVIDGHSTLDTEGTDLPNRQNARCEALRLAGHVLYDEDDRLLSDEDWKLEATNTAGQLVLALDLFFTEVPTVPSFMSAPR